MGDKSKIEWCDATWNPVVGCSKVSEGCRNCYAFDLHGLRYKAKLEGKQLPEQYLKPFKEIQLFRDRLDQPYRWKRPRRIFVNSLSDLFHPDVPFDFIGQVFSVMGYNDHHTFMVLTKRPARMLEFFKWYQDISKDPETESTEPFILPNVWIGVTVENQQAADERIPLLLQTPASVRFLSCEPLLGEVNLGKWLMSPGWAPSYYDPDNIHGHPNAEPTNEYINWVIVGGESGSKARPMLEDWARGLRDQCQAAIVPYFFKQRGEWMDFQEATCPDRLPASVLRRSPVATYDGTEMIRVGKWAAGRMLDGRTWDEFPEGSQT